MLLAQRYLSDLTGESLLYIPCGSKMRNDRSKGKSVVKKPRVYQRILPRPTESYGQPLSIVTSTEKGQSSTGEWLQPTKASEAIYNEPAKNIFLQLQEEPIPSKSEDDETYELPLIQAIGAPTDTTLLSEDSSYIHFFVEELPSVLFVDHLFPNALDRILGMTLGNRALWHSVLAVSSFLADKVVGRPTSRMYVHLHHALPLIQSAIQNDAINDTHIVAVFLLAYLNLTTGEIASAGRHLDGLQLMLEQRATTADDHDPLINTIRRLSIRLDNVRGATGRELAFSTHKLETGVSHRDWLTRLIPQDNLGLVEWAIAEFELEDLANQMVHLHLRARTLRSSPTHNPATDEHELLFRAEVLLNDLRRWKLRPIFMAAEASENVARLDPFGDLGTPSFLHYSPLVLRNVVYASLLIMYYRLELLGSLIIRPQVGPEPVERVDTAVTLCRTFVSFKALRGRVPSNMVIPLVLAGFVLGENTHPQGISSIVHTLMEEFQWICDQLAEIDRTSGLTSASLAVNTLCTIWRNPGRDPWDIFFEKSDF